MTERDAPQSREERGGWPADMADIWVDDRLLDALSHGSVPLDHHFDDADNELASLLSGWRADIVEQPLPTSPTVDECMLAVKAQQDLEAGKRSAWRRFRVVGAVAAVAGVAVGALAIVAQDAHPGGPLWSMKEALYGGEATATMASASAQDNLERAEKALATGDRRTAAQFVADTQREVAAVSGDGDRQRLQDWAQRLVYRVGPIPDNPITLVAPPSATDIPALQVPDSSTLRSRTATQTPIPTTASQVDPRRFLGSVQVPSQTPPPSTSTSQSPVAPTTTTVPNQPPAKGN